MRITYLQHSGFTLEYGDVVLIFDYYKGLLPEFDARKKIYVFASHAHQDHFKRSIFEWADKYRDITYILSEDIEAQGPEGKTVYAGVRKDLEAGGLKIKTLRSTDEGAAFIVRMKDKVIYHAGDLNWWHWEEEGRVYNEWMKRNYRHEINKIEGMHIDVAFVPLDPRLKAQYYWGLDYFMRHTDTDVVFPMHMWEHYELYEKLMEQEDTAVYRDKVMHIVKEGQVFEI